MYVHQKKIHQAIRAIIRTTTIGTLTFGSALSYSQDSEEDLFFGLEEVIVTAQRRAESVQDASLSIEAHSGNDIRARGITSAQDLAYLGVGLNVGNDITPLVNIRGVGDLGVIATANQAIVVSVDGVALSRPGTIPGNTFDLERVEILKGPQGTFYGRNANGGAINYITARPVIGENTGYLQAEFGNYSKLSAEGAYNVSLSDTVALRGAFQVIDRDGYLSDGTDADERQSFRLQALFEPSDDLNIRLFGSYTDLDTEAVGHVRVSPTLPSDPWEGNRSRAESDFYLALADANFAAALAAGCIPGPPPTGNCPLDSSQLQAIDTLDGFSLSETTILSAEINYDFGPGTLTVIPGYIDFELSNSNTPAGFNFTALKDTSEQTSLEIRYGADGDFGNWVVGVFGLEENQTSLGRVRSGIVQNVRTSYKLDTETYAVFGEGTFNITDSFRAIAGARFTSDERSISDILRGDVSPSLSGAGIRAGLGLPPCIPAPAPGIPGFSDPGTFCDFNLAGLGATGDDETFEDTTWKLGIEADVAEDSLLFATVSTGFKAGGFNSGVDAVDINSAASYDQEEMTAYTIGLRNRLFDNRLQLNVELFHWEYEDLQFSGVAPDGIGVLNLGTVNAGNAELTGFNIDVVAAVSETTTLRAAVEYNDTEYTDFAFLGPTGFNPQAGTGCVVTVLDGPLTGLSEVDCSGLPLIKAPEWTANAGIEQIVSLGDAGSLSLQAAAKYESERFVERSFLPQYEVDSYVIVDATLTYNSPNESWFVSLYGRNITEDENYTGGGAAASPFVAGYGTAQIGAPRTYGIRAGIDF